MWAGLMFESNVKVKGSEIEDISTTGAAEDEVEAPEEFAGVPGSEEDLERFFKKVRCKRRWSQLVATAALVVEPSPRHPTHAQPVLCRHTGVRPHHKRDQVGLEGHG